MSFTSFMHPRSLPLLLLLAATPAAAQLPPDCSITGPSIACGSAELCGPSGDYNYRWFGPDGSQIGDGRCLGISASGRYQLIVVDRATGASSERCGKVVEVSPAVECSIEGPERICAGSSAVLCAPEGDVSWSWSGPGDFHAETRCIEVSQAGTYSLLMIANGSGCGSACSRELAVESCETNHAPDCSHAAPSVARLWSGGADFQRVEVLGVTDPDGDPVAIEITGVTHDEPGKKTSCPSARRVEGGVELLAERDGGGNGRVYEIRFTARDGQGGACEGSVRVCVPHDHGQEECGDNGQLANALEVCDASKARINAVRKSAGRATLEYSLDQDATVMVGLYDLTGRRVATIESSARSAGSHSVSWDIAPLPRGMYFVRLRSEIGNASRAVPKLD